MATPGAPPTAAALARKLTAIDKVGGILCHICSLTLGTKKEFDSHYLAHSTGTTVITYTCVACNVSINNYPSFRGHCYSQHVIKDKFQCEHCNRPFSKQSVLTEHIDNVHKLKFKCNKLTCDKLFPTKKELHLHQAIHKSERNTPPYLCYTCNLIIDGIETCEDHIDEHCIFTYYCPICNETISKDNAAKHLSQHFTGEVLKTQDSRNNEPTTEMPEDSSINIVGGILCQYCKILFKNRSEFDMHFSDEHPKKAIMYSCNICNKQFERYNLFGDHCYYHYTRSRFACESCEMRFSRLSLLVLHAERHTSGATKGRFPCAYCGLSLATHRQLHEHTRDDHDGAALACPQPSCPQVFQTPKELIFHYKSHKSSLERWCHQCGLQFPNLAAAERHLDIHKKKQFTCPVCAKIYSEKYTLMKHIPQHFEVVFHMCKVCGKVFNAKNRLVEHIKIHSSVKTFECHFCNKGFFKPYQLSQHLNIHTGERPYRCDACPKTFASLPNQKKHMRKMHNLPSNPSDKPKKTRKVTKKKEPTLQMEIENKPNNTSGTEDSNSQEMKETFDFCIDMNDSAMDAAILTSLVEGQMPEESPDALEADYSIAELTPILPEDTNQLISELLGEESICGSLDGWCEYGPDFAEEPQLPHVAPQLVSPPQPAAPPAPWEPVITKVCSNYFPGLDDVGAARYAFVNSNIF